MLIQPHSAAVQVVFNPGGAGPGALPGRLARRRRRGPARLVEPGPGPQATRSFVVLTKNGVPTGEYEDFLTGFVAEDGQVWGRPAGLAFLKDGSLLVGDDANSVIYRVTYTGGGK